MSKNTETSLPDGIAMRCASRETDSFARRLTLRDGPGEGRRLIAVKCGKLFLTLTEDAALDIATLSYAGENVGFLSKNGIGDKDKPFPNLFPGGMLYTCGLDSVGDREGHPTHGRLHNIAAALELLRVNGDGSAEIEGTIRDTALFGQDLCLRRKITVTPEKVLVEDILTNEGFRPEEICLLYHLNVGWPFLAPDTRIEAEVKESIPRTPFAAEEIAKWQTMEAPDDGIDEQVFYHKTADGKVRLVSPHTGLALTYRFDRGRMPWFLQWKSRGSGDYALGIEPSTTRLDGDFESRTLHPGESLRFFAELTFETI